MSIYLHCTTVFETGRLLQQKKQEDTMLLRFKHENAIYKWAGTQISTEMDR
jgi:hypothetical protein